MEWIEWVILAAQGLAVGISGAFSDSSSKSKSESSSRTGLFDDDAARVSSDVLPQIQEVFQKVFGRSQQDADRVGIIDGVQSGTSAGFDAQFRDLTSRTSAQQASRGFLRPGQGAGVVARAGVNFAPSFAGASSRDLISDTTSAIDNESRRFADVLGTLQQITALLGGSSSASSSGASKNQSVNFGVTGGG